jgi:hypothetical protein
MVVPTLNPVTVTPYYPDTDVLAFGDTKSGTSNPLTCGARTCSTTGSNNVVWDNTNKKFTIKSLGASDVAGPYTVQLTCSLTSYPNVSPATGTFLLTVVEPITCGSTENVMIAPSLPDLVVTRAYIDTYINAYSDNVSGTTDPPTCGARICTSDHPNVLWEKIGQKF